MPGKQRIGCHKRLDFIEHSAAKDLGLHGKSYPLFVGELQPLYFKLILKYTIFFNEIVDDRLLTAVKPAGDVYSNFTIYNWGAKTGFRHHQ
jgi:hypothetical protein